MILGDVVLKVLASDSHKEILRLIEAGQEIADSIEENVQFPDLAEKIRSWIRRIDYSLSFIFNHNPLVFDTMTVHSLLTKLTTSTPADFRDVLRLNIYLMRQKLNELDILVASQQSPDTRPSQLVSSSPTSQMAATTSSDSLLKSDSPRNDDKSVFIVHGHDDAAKESVARLIQGLKLKPVILHEQSNKGRTLIEKFEGHSGCAFAVVLLTPDDEGRTKPAPADVRKKPVYRNRARQNVVLELGFFMAKLTRSKVCALVKGEVERPSDIDGVVYVTMDDHGAWRGEIAKEMNDAGLPVDFDYLNGKSQ